MRTTAALAFSSLAVWVACLATAPVWAYPPIPEIKLIADDGAFDDTLGQAVDIEGNIAIAGANRTDGAGSGSGSAYLFDVTTGAQLFELTASDADAKDAFGHSVALSGNLAFVSAFGNSDAGPSTGSVYLFDVTTGQEVAKWTASDADEDDNYGHGLDISGNRAIVGAYHDDDKGSNSGSAYIYDVSTGEELFKITASDGAANDWYGYWVAIDGDLAIVGARRANALGDNSGAAYVYDVNTGEELFQLTASDGAAGDEFGYAVKMEGNRAIIGAFLDDDGGFNSGSAYVFDLTTGEELYKLTAPDAEGGDEFGRAVGISGNTAIISSENDDESGGNSGSAYIYDLTFGDLLGKIIPSDGQSGAQFSTAVEISGTKAVSGAWLQNTASAIDAGQAYIYDVSAWLPPGADFNGDGVVDEADVALWESSSPIPRLDVNRDNQIDGTDFLLWQQHFQPEELVDESPANLDQQGPVDTADLLIWEQSYGADGIADLDGDGDTDGADFLILQQEFTPYDPADENHDRKVDGLDLQLWESSYGWDADINGDGILDGDANGDGIVSELDYLWWQEQSKYFGPTAAVSHVPEPTSLLLFTEILLSCLFGCRHGCQQKYVA